MHGNISACGDPFSLRDDEGMYEEYRGQLTSWDQYKENCESNEVRQRQQIPNDKYARACKKLLKQVKTIPSLYSCYFYFCKYYKLFLVI